MEMQLNSDSFGSRTREPASMRFLADTRKYGQFVVYSAKAHMKAEVANSYLSWLWWILDPLLFMMVYTFIAEIVFKKQGLYFPVFVIIGLSVWNFFNKNIIQSISLMRTNKGIITKIYIPKHILLLQNMLINGFKMCISFGLVFVFMIAFQVPFSFYVFYCLPYLFVLCVLTFGFGIVCLHLGVFVEDLQNVVTVGLRLVFYLSGVFYDLNQSIPAPYNRLLLACNPIALIMDGCRNALLYQKPPEWGFLLGWLVLGAALSFVGIGFVYRYENSYGKVV